MTYQTVSGTVNAGAHPGSYNGQDAYNDMLVIDESSKHGQWATAQHGDGRTGESSGLYARCPSNPHRGGTEQVDELKDQIAGTLDASYYKGCGERQGIERDVVCMSDRKGHNGITEDGTATTLTAQEKERPVVGTSIVRRLTPRECERLQGMPDDWSRWGVNEKGEVYELPDSARYRLQGNGIATPFWKWLLERISALYDTTPTMGSLFDGQASFPMLWEEINGNGTAVWSSEIEKHAVAVAKYHFPENA